MINLHIYPSNMANESRIFKITAALIEAGLVQEIVLVGIGEGTFPETETMDDSRKIWRVPLTKFPFLGWKVEKVLRYIQWIWKVFRRYRHEPITMINCHSLFDLPIGVLLKRKTGGTLIYDAHELETERNGLKGKLKHIFKIIEKQCIKHIDYLFVVSDSIAHWYQETYHLTDVAVIKNIPVKHPSPLEKSPILRDRFNIPPGHRLYLYQGALLEGRGIPILLAVFSKTDITDHIVFMGYGPLTQMIKTAATLHPTIHFLDAVPHQQINTYASSADIGISLIENTCLSYYYCLPNKVFEYVFSGIPCIVSDFPDMKAFVYTYSCGWVTPVNEANVYRLIKEMTATEFFEKQQHVYTMQNNPHFDWQNEKKILLDVYNTLLPTKNHQENPK